MSDCFFIFSLNMSFRHIFIVFFFDDTPTTEIYTFPTRRSSDLAFSYHHYGAASIRCAGTEGMHQTTEAAALTEDRKSTRLNSSHSQISYAVFCLKKKKQISTTPLGTPVTPTPLIRPTGCKSETR